MRGSDDARVNPIERECEAGTPFLLPKRRPPGKALSITHKFSTDADTQLNINEAS